jgi:flagellar biosynthesis protein FliR
VTFLSCLAIGLAFAIAVGLLVLAGILLGWLLPHWIERFRKGRSGPRVPPV